MADNPLLAALLGAQVSPRENLYGIGAEAIGTVTPNLYSPYASPGRNLASVAGAGLLAGLLGYQARREAEAESRALMPRVTELLGAQSPEAIGQLAGAEGFPSRLMPLAQQMMLSQYSAQQEAAAKRAAQMAELEGKATFELGPIGTALANREQAAQLALIQARNAGLRGIGSASTKPQPTSWDKIPAAAKSQFAMAEGTFNELRALADQFDTLNLTAAEYQVAKQVPGSKSDLAYSKALTLVPTAARLMGEVGNLNEFEQQRQIQSTLGSRLSGTQSIAARLRQLADTAESMTNNRRAYYDKQAAFSSTPLVDENMQSQTIEGTTQAETDDIAKRALLAEIEAQERELDAQLAARGQ